MSYSSGWLLLIHISATTKGGWRIFFFYSETKTFENSLVLLRKTTFSNESISRTKPFRGKQNPACHCRSISSVNILYSVLTEIFHSGMPFLEAALILALFSNSHVALDPDNQDLQRNLGIWGKYTGHKPWVVDLQEGCLSPLSLIPETAWQLQLFVVKLSP